MILSLLTKIYQSQFLQIKDLVHCSSVVTSHNWARQVATPSLGFQSIDTVSQSEKNVQVVQPSHPISKWEKLSIFRHHLSHQKVHICITLRYHSSIYKVILLHYPSVQYQNENRLTNRCWYWTGGEGAFKLSLYVSFQFFFVFVLTDYPSSLLLNNMWSVFSFPSLNMSSTLFERDIRQSISSGSPFTGHQSPFFLDKI